AARGAQLAGQSHAHVLPATARNKIGELAQLCSARVMHMDREHMVLRVSRPRNLWQQCVGRQRGLEIAIYLGSVRGADATPIEVTVQITPFGCRGKQGEQ